jgi:RNA recognition motif-containing protein
MQITKVRTYPNGAFQLTSCINPANVQQHIIGNTLHIGNLSRTATEKELSSKFAEFGKLADVFIVKDPFTQYHFPAPFSESRGFGFVTYEDAADSQRAMEAMNHVDFCGR